ncbi:hypothetical protein AAE478_008691 [Parahypoxylon ruwenzoriense]
MDSAHRLCTLCAALGLETLFMKERTERKIGPLSNYQDADCPFCHLISRAIGLVWGSDWNTERLCSSSSTPLELFIQSRSPLSVFEFGHVKHPQPRILLAVDQRPPNREQNRAIVREIDRENRFIIAEVESLSTGSKNDDRLILRRPVSGRVDIALVKGWLRDCKSHRHSKEDDLHPAYNLFKSGSGLQLVDVMDECLVQKAKRCEFAALSYVWGQVPAFRSTVRNVESLSEPNSLSPRHIATLGKETIPQTIVDAMELVRKIGIRYLWIDTLCIVQDDPRDKVRLIRNMDNIYNCATVTVIAAGGSDARAGLMGISSRAGIPIRSTDIADRSGKTSLSLEICPPTLSQEVRRSIWYTRGWTFQEQCLSPRCLYFTPNEVFFNCQETQWTEAYSLRYPLPEDMEVQVRTGPPWWGGKLRKDPDPTPYRYLRGPYTAQDIQEYQRAVQDYSRKDLSFQNDVLNAFEGIFNRFNTSSRTLNLTITQAQGIPNDVLFQAILWFPSDKARKRAPTKSSEECFSTWSWSSWVGPIEFVFADSLWLSRTISQAPIKHAAIHVAISAVYYGGNSSHRCWSRSLWKAAGEAREPSTMPASDDFARMKAYLTATIGLDVDRLLTEPNPTASSSLVCGELGFWAAYLPTQKILISRKEGNRVRELDLSGHRGEFRFDVDADDHVDELVVMVVADTIRKPPDPLSILLGLATQDGISTRVGIGYVYYSKDLEVARPHWQYRWFQVR